MEALQLNGSDHHVKFDKCSLSVQSLDRLDRQGDMRDDSAEILFRSFFFFFLQKALEQFWFGQDSR